MNTITIPGVSPWIILLIAVWTIPWKGVALWKAARLSHKWWFVILLVINTVGILEIIYIFLVARKYTVETMDKPEKEPVTERLHAQEPKPTNIMPKPAQPMPVSQPTKPVETKPAEAKPEVKPAAPSPEKESPKMEPKKETPMETGEVKSESSEK